MIEGQMGFIGRGPGLARKRSCCDQAVKQVNSPQAYHLVTPKGQGVQRPSYNTEKE